jgi:hypothetical protein
VLAIDRPQQRVYIDMFAIARFRYSMGGALPIHFRSLSRGLRLPCSVRFYRQLTSKKTLLGGC